MKMNYIKVYHTDFGVMIEADAPSKLMLKMALRKAYICAKCEGFREEAEAYKRMLNEFSK